MTDEEIANKIVESILDHRNKTAIYEEKKKVWLARRDKIVKEVMKRTDITKVDAEFRVDKMLEGSYPEW